MTAAVVETAMAKVNLALHVTGRREDGYHLLDSLVAFAATGDRVSLRAGPMSLQIDGPFARGLEADSGNLCWRAAELAGASVAISLEKNLPVASGIGGGSADAAAVLRGLERMGHSRPEGIDRLGADIPVCMLSQPARMQGIGEIVTPLSGLPRVSAVLVNPGHEISTPAVFRALTSRDNAPLGAIPSWSDLAALIGWLRQTRNDLEPAARDILPLISQVLAALEQNGAGLARMSGSGATCFGLFESDAQARKAAAALSRHGWWAEATELVPSQRGR
ncbi:4-(cytidine 5'-diphospho)-2-C-methyl-D-erythritol kinase [Paracoccus seriniphilus]|uniref:4-diphosphocytidyl-2-C-methyl-D-erythritol kinase n=1 Tax=Paracoccus seriniphilus TaxID=184748 RepID=A0A239PST7_9RHOB|nr:4-(cytidine 5'-diphospho)-2-C-methyl-D-erythritol kinase [Paracoccus seriniphilus]WCR14317.1 4-(cytidine 5'-diphospho)-2-C-methyl-D-erythritol kinase [Paracoccus seriniphilus]SNT72976.1 4-diphosphocytidyl-2-C-methyl-D-erythritol kinase [Paracoccus seriniphilus]